MCFKTNKGRSPLSVKGRELGYEILEGKGPQEHKK